MQEKVEQDIALLVEEKKENEKRQKEIDHEIAGLEKLRSHLDTCLDQLVASTFPDRRAHINSEMGIVKAVRTFVYSRRGQIVLPTGIRDGMVEAGFKDTVNLLPEIHAALRRLKKRGEIVKGMYGKKKGYRSPPLGTRKTTKHK